MEVRNHLLYSGSKQIRFVDSPNRKQGIRQLYLIMHYTAGRNLASSVAWFQNPQASASAHIVVGANGDVVQMVRFDQQAWHAGQSSWGELIGMNAHSIGIELDNPGKLSRAENGQWKSWFGGTYQPANVMVARHKHESVDNGWHIFPPKQLDAAIEVAAALHAKYRFLDILGYEDISPRRKTDPGPAFPLLSFRSRILGRE
jgi:N-acetylmuramoyl-L-alanine amidase